MDVEALYKQFGPMVLRRCRRVLKDEHRALDAMQETFVRVLRYEHRLTAESPSSLLYRIATHVCLNMRRSELRRGGGRTDAYDDELSAIIAAVDRAPGLSRRILAKIFAGEQERTMLIAVLHYVDGLTLEEVAAEVGMSVSGVRKRLRGLKERVSESAA